MKLNGNAIRPGNVIEHKARLWVAVKISHVKPGKGGAFAQVELRDIRDGTKLNERFRATESVERVILMKRNAPICTLKVISIFSCMARPMSSSPFQKA